MAPGKGHEIAMQKLSPVQMAAVGSASGAIEVTMLQPMLYCKNATQQKIPLTLDPRVMYRGLAVSIANMATLTCLQFPMTNIVKGLITGGKARTLTDGEMIAAGFCGGALSGTACCPMEGIMIQQQRFGSALIETPGKMISVAGVSALFRGMTTSVGREGLFTMGYMGLSPVIARRLTEGQNMAESTAKVAGAIGAGIVAATLSHPLDTLKTCMQGDIAREKFGSLTQTARSLFSEQGIGAFYRGWAWRCSRMMGAIFIIGECKDRLAPIMFRSHFENVNDAA